MITGPLVTERVLNENEMGGSATSTTCPADATLMSNSQAGGEQLFGDKNGECCPDCAPNDTELNTLLLEGEEVGVIARPLWMAHCAIRADDPADDVTIGVEDTEPRDRHPRQ